MLIQTLALDEDGDSTMQSTPDDDDKDDLFPSADVPTTPKAPTSELSPPTSHGRGLFSDSAAPSATGSLTNTSALNENGKRSLTIGGGGAKGTQSSQKSGYQYQWEKDEDSPGYAWKNKRATEDANRSWDNVVERDRMIGNRYGDVLATVVGVGVST